MSTPEFTEYKSKSVVKQERLVAKAAQELQVDTLTGLVDGWYTLKDMNEASINELLSGPTVAIFCDDTFVRNMPKRALMAVVPQARTKLSKDPTLKEVRFPKADPKAMSAILNAIRTKLQDIELPVGHTFEQTLKLYDAAHVLGIGHLTDTLLHKLRGTIAHNLLAYRLVDEVLERLPVSDPVFLHLAHTLANMRYKGSIPDPEEFEEYLEERPSLKRAMAKVDKKCDEQKRERLRKHGRH